MRFQRAGRKVLGTLVCTAMIVAPGSVLAAAPQPGVRAQLEGATPLTVATDGLSDADMRAPVKSAVQRDAKPVFELYESMGNSLEGMEIDVTMAEPETPGIVEVHITGKGADGTSKQESIRCEYCTESDLVSRTVDAIGKLLPRLDSKESEEPDAPPPTPAEGDGHTEPDPNDDRHTKGGDKKPLGPMGIGGAVMMGLGVAAIIPGAILAAKEDETNMELFTPERRSTRPAGYALIGGGAALFVTGTALLVVDRMRAKKRHGPDNDDHKASALLLPTGNGVVITGRF